MPSDSISPDDMTIPLLQGEICMQYTRCGKATCRCREGNLHGPYYYRVWRDGDSVRKEYVRRERLMEIQASCDAYRALMEQLKQARIKRLELQKRIRHECRKIKPRTSANPQGAAA
ncbi:MAG: DUF6788 family protein [Capsulimonas sp.]|uniref:DUF6788 family protein n=1 Tax=Capsulimonas sp. TaxID=2494211 RepID=UPI003265524C